MKKFTLILMMALMAVVSWAQAPHQLLNAGPKAPAQKTSVKWARHNAKTAFDPEVDARHREMVPARQHHRTEGGEQPASARQHFRSGRHESGGMEGGSRRADDCRFLA